MIADEDEKVSTSASSKNGILDSGHPLVEKTEITSSRFKSFHNRFKAIINLYKYSIHLFNLFKYILVSSIVTARTTVVVE